ncbi:GAF domain-containing protein [Fulvivirga sp. M361]|uniref:GAF domain-containing protein n=1 Tax=Fulvivirga sp. M361 TaxID=2594266 RepID=UPI00117AC3BE|nr:GAF domain-containing protein [Fulvivirga sp. M361]TRX48120.1 GAF domain-containing protein [Fulvivirga sp. M361]
MMLFKILQIGVKPNTPDELKKTVSLTNAMALLISFGVALPFYILSLLHFKEIAFLPLVGTIICLGTIGINGLGLYNVSRLILGLAPFTLTTIFGAYLTPTGERPIATIFSLEIAFTVVPFIIFRIKERPQLIFSTLIILVSSVFFTKEISDFFDKDLDLTVLTDGYMFNLSIMTALLISCGSIFFLSWNNEIAKKEQKELVKMMDVQNEELKQSEETLKSNLKQVHENQEAEKQRNWATEGMARFGNLLRKNQNSEEMFDEMVSGITRYLEANQSALFLVNRNDEDNITIDLKSCYAYNRKKFLEKSLQPGQGLVGQAYYEKDIIYMTNVPDSYLQITSGLGESMPKSVLIVPLMVNEVVEGFFEIASFEEFESHKVEFLQNLGESIASFININRINTKTKLLLEETQQQAEEMRSQEEEMRQNMEELQATQEEMHRKETEYVERIKQLESELAALKGDESSRAA